MIILDKIPLCDFCKKKEAIIDGKSILDVWGYMCRECYFEFGIGLGLGKGQELILRK